MTRTVLLSAIVTTAMLLVFCAGVPASNVAGAETDSDEPATFTVNSRSDRADASAGDGTCATTTDVCTLRAAIEEANLHPGPDTIEFRIPRTRVKTKTIVLERPLPTLSDATGPTTIDGYTQRGSAPNTDPSVSNARIRVQVTGAQGKRIDGLTITSPSNIIRGLALFNLDSAIQLYGQGARDNHVVGNFVGTNAAGTYYSTQSDGQGGVVLVNGASNNSVGGTQPAERNVVSGNAPRGIAAYGGLTTNNRIINNIVGLGPKGDKRLPNHGHGVDINGGASQNKIGGTGPGERNVVSGNGNMGVEISHYETTTQNEVVGNLIGTDPAGRSARYASNGEHGVHVEDRVTNNVVAENVVMNNGGGGVVLRYSARGNRIGPNNTITKNRVGISLSGDASDQNTITRNSIFGNAGLGIDIYPLGGPNPNYPSDTDTGSNEQLNFPVLEGAKLGEVNGNACGGCTVEVFLADGGADEYGEGKTFVGSVTANSDGTFTASVSGVASGDYVTATATDASGNTSEFSRNKVVS